MLQPGLSASALPLTGPGKAVVVAVPPSLISAQHVVASPALAATPADPGSLLMLEEKRISRSVLENPDAVADFMSFEEAIFALNNIVKNKLYLASGSANQSDYCRARWNLTAMRTGQLLACVPVLTALRGFARRPDSDKICRALMQCRNEEAGWQELWSKVLEAPNPAGRISATLIVSVHNQVNGQGEIPPVEWSPPEELVKEIEVFMGEISLDPVWFPQSPVSLFFFVWRGQFVVL